MPLSSPAAANNVKAWATFVGNSTGGVNGNCTISGSLNVASVARSAVGQYDVTFTSPMPDTNYMVYASAGDGSTTATPAYQSKTVNGVRLFWSGSDRAATVNLLIVR